MFFTCNRLADRLDGVILTGISWTKNVFKEDIKNNEFPVTVGGANGKKQTITVEKGQYLYIQKISGGEIGHLLISK